MNTDTTKYPRAARKPCEHCGAWVTIPMGQKRVKCSACDRFSYRGKKRSPQVLHAEKLSESQRLWLSDVSAGRNPMDRLHGRSAHGGAAGTHASLMKRGLIIITGNDVVLTERGRTALKAARR